jgi:hypothetical protein
MCWKLILDVESSLIICIDAKKEARWTIKKNYKFEFELNPCK